MSRGIVTARVTYREFPEGDIIALFPEIWEDRDHTMIQSYMRNGQHASASLELLTELPTPSLDKFMNLHNELRAIGYDLILTA